MSSVSDEEILDYVDGEADEETIRAVEQAIDQDPEVRKTAEMMRLSKETVQNELKEFFEPPDDFINKLKVLEAEQDKKNNNIVKRYLSWRPLVEVANSNKVKLLVAACFAFVFVVSGDIHQLTKSSWQGQISVNPEGSLLAPKTRSASASDKVLKEIKFVSSEDNAVTLTVRLYGPQSDRTSPSLEDSKTFDIYSGWVKSLMSLIDANPDDMLEIYFGQSIQFIINTAVAGDLSLKLIQDSDENLIIFDNVKVAQSQISESSKLRAQPPAGTGTFVMQFTPKEGNPINLAVPFKLKEYANLKKIK